MILLSWNCRGLGTPRTVRVLKEMTKSHRPNFLFLSETLVEGNKVEVLSSKLGFSNYFSVDRQGRGGGLAVFWKHNVRCSIFVSSQNHIDVVIKEINSVSWRLTCFYGFPERERKQAFWDFLRFLSTKSQLPWCIFGDFNDLLYSTDKKGRHPHPNNLLNGFKSSIEDCCLAELELKGVSSDHEPINLELFNMDVSKKQVRFKFENTWMKEEKFHDDVVEFWQSLPAIHLLPKLTTVSDYMAKWGRNFFHKFREKVIKQKEIIDQLKDREDDDGIQLYFNEKEKLSDLLLHEELYWKQRAKTFWLEEGDSNSRFFHASASSRKKMNLIVGLRAEDGSMITEHGHLCNLLERYYKIVLSDTNHADITKFPNYSDEGVITNEQNNMLTAEIEYEEFPATVKSMHPDQASGPDRLNPAFFSISGKY
ncbi:uncharacterized protein LOC141704586 [Apium graveolens]|uniref:uncharacterized protein LOC141704586 n=1 Tax=Apium graveolens TaxID=4045 RepID=UPI003D79B045